MQRITEGQVIPQGLSLCNTSYVYGKVISFHYLRGTWKYQFMARVYFVRPYGKSWLWIRIGPAVGTKIGEKYWIWPRNKGASRMEKWLEKLLNPKGGH